MTNLIRRFWLTSALFGVCACNLTITNDDRSSLNTDDTTPTSPSHITGSYLTYVNGRARCGNQVDKSRAEYYKVSCHVVVLGADGIETVATSVDQNLSYKWLEPKVKEGSYEHLECENSQGALKFSCEVKAKSVKIEFAVEFSQGDKKRAEKDQVLIPYLVKVAAGLVPSLGNIELKTNALKAGNNKESKREDLKFGVHRDPFSPLAFDSGNIRSFCATKDGQGRNHLFYALKNKIFSIDEQGLARHYAGQHAGLPADTSHRLRVWLNQPSIVCYEDQVIAVEESRLVRLYPDGRVKVINLDFKPLKRDITQILPKSASVYKDHLYVIASEKSAWAGGSIVKIDFKKHSVSLFRDNQDPKILNETGRIGFKFAEMSLVEYEGEAGFLMHLSLDNYQRDVLFLDAKDEVRRSITTKNGDFALDLNMKKVVYHNGYFYYSNSFQQALHRYNVETKKTKKFDFDVAGGGAFEIDATTGNKPTPQAFFRFSVAIEDFVTPIKSNGKLVVQKTYYQADQGVFSNLFTYEDEVFKNRFSQNINSQIEDSLGRILVPSQLILSSGAGVKVVDSNTSKILQIHDQKVGNFYDVFRSGMFKNNYVSAPGVAWGQVDFSGFDDEVYAVTSVEHAYNSVDSSWMNKIIKLVGDSEYEVIAESSRLERDAGVVGINGIVGKIHYDASKKTIYFTESESEGVWFPSDYVSNILCENIQTKIRSINDKRQVKEILSFRFEDLGDNGELFIQCHISSLDINAAGEIAFTTELGDIFIAKPDASGQYTAKRIIKNPKPSCLFQRGGCYNDKTQRSYFSKVVWLDSKNIYAVDGKGNQIYRIRASRDERVESLFTAADVETDILYGSGDEARDCGAGVLEGKVVAEEGFSKVRSSLTSICVGQMSDLKVQNNCLKDKTFTMYIAQSYEYSGNVLEVQSPCVE